MKGMLGQATAAASPPATRWLRRAWGCGDIHVRQKWSAVWDVLGRYPAESLRVLDAGCGDGQWALELACRRPGWTLTGLDRNAASLVAAEQMRQALHCQNASFIEADFMSFVPVQRYDVVLSVASAHYLSQAGEGSALFHRFRQWLAPAGRLLMLAPRARQEAGFLSWLSHPAWHAVFSTGELAELCAGSQLRVRRLDARIGRCGTLAKQLAWSLDASLGRAAAVGYPLELALTALDQRRRPHHADRSLMWLLEAAAEL